MWNVWIRELQHRKQKHDDSGCSGCVHEEPPAVPGQPRLLGKQDTEAAIAGLALVHGDGHVGKLLGDEHRLPAVHAVVVEQNQGVVIADHQTRALASHVQHCVADRLQLHDRPHGRFARYYDSRLCCIL